MAAQPPPRTRPRSKPTSLERMALRLADVGPLVGLSESGVRNLIRQRRLRALRVGKRALLVRREEVERFLASLPEVA